MYVMGLGRMLGKSEITGSDPAMAIRFQVFLLMETIDDVSDHVTDLDSRLDSRLFIVINAYQNIDKITIIMLIH